MFMRYGRPFVKLLGSDTGILAYEIEGANRDCVTVIFKGRDAFIMAAIPAALAAHRLAAGLIEADGLIAPGTLTAGRALLDALARHGISVETVPESGVRRS